MSRTETVLSFSPYAIWQLHALYEVAIGHNLRWRRHEFHYVSCDGLFTDCDMFWEATVGPRPANACAACQATAKALLGPCQLPPVWLGRYLRPDDAVRARAFVDGLADAQLLEAGFAGHPIAEWVKSSVYSHFRINRLDLTNPRHCRALRSYLYSGALAVSCISRLLDEIAPTIMLLFNGRLSIPRIALELARQRGIRVVCHERGITSQTLLFWENENCLALRPYARMRDRWGGVPLQTHEVAKVTDWLADRAHGTRLNWRPFSVRSSLGFVEEFLGRHRGRQVWSVFTSSTDEVVAETEYGSPFGSQQRWIEDTIAFARATPAIALVIRVHPNSGSRKSTGRNSDELALFESLRADLPDNAIVVMPDDPVSTYALIERTDLGLVYCSTVALELACRGKRVLAAGGCPWIYCNSIVAVRARDSYREQLTELATRTPSEAEGEQIAVAAYRFAFAYAVRWHIPFPLVTMPDVHHGALTARTLEELQPGVHDCLDYATEVVLGIRESVPSPTAPVRPEAEAEELGAVRRGLRALANPAGPDRPIRASVVITCYNYGAYLRDCVRSVADQTFRDLEVIIVNDGSTDNSAGVAAACEKEFPGLRLTVINQENSGQPACARNAGIRQAKGEFILPLDADDQIAPDYLEECFQLIDRRPGVDLVYADSLYDNGKARTRKAPGRFDTRSLAQGNHMVYCSLYRRALWARIGGYRENVRGYEDWDFWLAASLAGASAVYLGRVGLLYRDKPTGVNAQTAVHGRVRTAQVMLNNPAAYTAEQLAQARAVVGGTRMESAPTCAPAATVPAQPAVGLPSAPAPVAAFAQMIVAAQEMVRRGRVTDAIAQVERARALAPSADAIARADEILQLLRNAAPAPVQPAAAGR